MLGADRNAYTLMGRELVFLYDDLMLCENRKFLNIEAEFVSYAYIKAKLYFYNDTKKKHVFAMPLRKNQNPSLVFGGLYVINNFEVKELPLCAYYNCSVPYTDKVMREDFIVPKKVQFTQINFTKMLDFVKGKYNIRSTGECITFVGNIENPIIYKSTVKNRKYYSTRTSCDTENFLNLIKENNKERKQKK